MVAQDITFRQQELAPKEDLARFSERWVALRRGHVVAQANSIADLLQLGEVREEDAVIYVAPPEPTIVY
jgi:hypothetical protein